MLTVDVAVYIFPSEGDDGKETLIPTSSSIQAAKEKREQAERAKAAAKLAAIGGTSLGNIMGVKDEEAEAEGMSNS